MQACTILRAIVVLPPQPEYRPVVPPQKPGNDNVENPSTDGHAPICVSERIDWRHSGKRCRCGELPLSQVDRNQNATSNDGHDQEDIPAHY